MKARFSIYIIVITIVACAFFSCQRPGATLVSAKQLVDSLPDSTLTLLSQIEKPEISLSKSDYALYTILKVQALLKCDSNLASAPSLSDAISYYTSKKDSNRTAEACFYAGRVAQESGDLKSAIDYYFKSKDLLTNSKDNKLQFLVRNYLGIVYSEQWLFSEEKQVYTNAFQYAKLLNDTSYIVASLMGIGYAYSGLEQEDSALYYQNYALNVSKKSAKYAIPNVQFQIALIYQQKGQPQRSLLYVDSVLQAYPTDAGSLSVKGSLYIDLQKYDSALHYLKYASNISTDLYVQARAAYKTADIFNTLHRYDSAYIYMTKYNSVRDSIEKKVHSAEVLKLTQVYNRNKWQETSFLLRQETAEKKQWLYMSLALISALLLLLGFIFLWYKSALQRKNIQIYQQEKETAELRTGFYKQLNQSYISQGHNRTQVSEEAWKSIAQNTDTIYNNFTKRLQDCYPKLNDGDIRYCYLLKMQLSRSEISEIMCVTEAAVKQRIIRVKREKMNIKDEIQLKDFLLKF